MVDFSTHCFVCRKETDSQNAKINKQLNLPVCDECSGTEEEKKGGS